MGGVKFTTSYRLRSWRRDLHVFISELCRGTPRAVPIRDRNKPERPDTAKLEPRNLQASQSRLGPSLLVRGEISGNEDLLIDGSVEGVVRLNERKLMIGPTANVKADITASEVVIRGNLKGNVFARDRIEVKNDGSVTGDLTTPQVFIEDGALFKGSIEIEKSVEKQPENVLSSANPARASLSGVAASANNI
ncbi:MAG TPA: polymer-forming cytoskeletal protein [Candidatus Acidoferrum sp.]|nr:polymer-forming cytoskeletal protein [Candidatus Acidoferrum sp.]